MIDYKTFCCEIENFLEGIRVEDIEITYLLENEVVFVKNEKNFVTALKKMS